MRQTKFVTIGQIVAVQGNRGEVKVIPETEFPERFFQMDSVKLFEKKGEQPIKIISLEECRIHKGAIILKLNGVDSISHAEMLRGMLIKVGHDELMPLPEGRFYIFQIIGLEAITTTGLKLGVITDVLQTGANDVYVVRPYDGITRLKEILIPVIPQVVSEIKPEEGFVIIELMDGLLD